MKNIGGAEFRKNFLRMNENPGDPKVGTIIGKILKDIEKNLGDTPFYSHRNAPAIKGFPDIAYRELICDAQIQAKRNPDWRNIRIIQIISDETWNIMEMIPNSRDIHRAFEHQLDTRIIPTKHYTGGTSFYAIPANIDVKLGTIVTQITFDI